MTSRIDTKTIDVNFPVPGINQSSQTFRSNSVAITNNLNIAREEISDLQAKTIEVESDLNHIVGDSGPLGEERTPAILRLNLVETGVTAGDYSGLLSLTVDAFGRVIALNEVAAETFPVAGSYIPEIDNFNTNPGSGSSAITVPRLTIDAQGRITSVAMETLTGFGILGHTLAANALLAGNATGRSAAFNPPASTVEQGHYLAYDNTGALVWKAFPVLNDGTVTSVAGGYAIKITDPATVPLVELDTAQLVVMPGDKIADDDFIVLHSMTGDDYTDGRDNSAVKVLWPEFVTKLDDTFLKEVVEDTAPMLGGDLNTNTYAITGDIDVEINSGSGRIKLDAQSWPKEPGSDGQVLTALAGGDLAWTTLEEPPEFPIHVSNLQSGPGILVTPEMMVETGPVTVRAALQTLEARSLPSPPQT